MQFFFYRVINKSLTFPATLETVDSNNPEYRMIRRFELHTAAQGLEALCYKQEGPEFVSRRCHCYFLIP
jgi:hypothetical protein